MVIKKAGVRGLIVLVVLLALTLLTGSQITVSSNTPRAKQPAAAKPVGRIRVTRFGTSPGTPVATRKADTPQHLWMERVTLMPGANSGPGLRPGARFMVVERGTVELTVQKGAISLTCAHRCVPKRGKPAATGVAPLNVPIQLHAGDTASQYDSTAFALRNPGSKTAVVLIEGLGPAPSIMPMGCGGGCF